MSRLPLAVVAALLLLAVPALALQDGEDVKLTTTGALVEIGKAALQSDVAVNTRTGEALVVYAASPDTSGQYEVFGQRIGVDGRPVGPRLALSDEGEDADPALVLPEPAVAYSATSDTWLVVFSIDDRTGGRPNDKFEIFARTVSATGAVGASRIQVSETGAVADASHDAEHPDVAWNPDRDEFLVAWSTPSSGAVADAIRVQRLSGVGGVLGSDTPISSTAAPHGGAWPTQRPGVAYDPVSGRWLVVWYAEPTPLDSFKDQEVFGQLLDGRVAATTEIAGDFRISTTGPDSDHSAHAGVPLAGATNPSPRAAAVPGRDGFHVVFQGDPGTGGLAANEYEVFLQTVTGAGALDGVVKRMSFTGPDGATDASAAFPTIATNAAASEGVVLWDADPGTGGLDPSEREVHGQRITQRGLRLNPNFRVSRTGPDGEPSTSAIRPSVAVAGGRSYQVTFDATPAATKREIYGDRLALPPEEPEDDDPPGGGGGGAAGSGGSAGGGAGTPAPPAGPGPAAVRDAAKLQVLRARVRRGRLDLLAQLTARATGTVRGTLRARGRTARFTATPRGGRLRVSARLPAPMRGATTGIVTLAYPGDARVRPATVRLRAASGRALLRRTRSAIAGGRLRVAGTISPRARGVVLLRLVAVVGGDVRELAFRAPIRAGRWALDAPLPADVARAGGQLDVQFTGYGPRRIRGEQLSKAL